MNCQTCKNPIINNYKECEWCGAALIDINNQDKIILFTAKWCGPSKFILPIIIEYKNQNPLHNIEIIDVDIQKDIAKKYSITNLPTLIKLYGDVILNKIVGSNINEVKLLLKS
jgi:thiol-disulfide isomerase/thioredoxin